MSKKFKINMIAKIIIIILGIGCIVYSFFTPNEDVSAYFLGFGAGLIAVSLLSLIRYIRMAKNSNYAKKIENEYNDERLIRVVDKSLALTFRISVIIEALAVIVLELVKLNTWGEVLSLIVCGQCFLYLLIYWILSKKM